MINLSSNKAPGKRILSDFEEELKWADSYSRLPVILEFWRRCNARGIRLDRFFKTLGEEWTGCDNISVYAGTLDRIFKTVPRVNLDDMMDRKEIVAYRTLPETITAYRGAYPMNAVGFSYSLDEAVAKGFPMLNRYRIRGASPFLLSVELPKRFCVLKADRQEQEIICVNRGVVRVTGRTEIKPESEQ
ncbi:MAG: hypothetical protein WCO94_11165 [Verrucomicrobiota bacterium]